MNPSEEGSRTLHYQSGKAQAHSFEVATIGLHWVGADGIILWANEAEMAMLGYTPEEYVGHHIAEFHADPAVVATMLMRLARGENVRNQEARLKCKDGAIKNVLVDSSVLWLDGSFVHTQCFTRTLPDQPALGKWQSNDEGQRQLMMLMPAAVYTCDAEGRLTFCNRRAVEIWGREPRFHDDGEKFSAALRLLRLDGSPIAAEESPMGRAVLTGRVSRNAELLVERADGSRKIISANIDPVRDAQGIVKGAIMVFDDVTDRKRGELLVQGQNRVLQLIVSDAPLSAVLKELALVAEAAGDGNTLTSISLLDADGLRLRHGAAPNLPDDFNRALEGTIVGRGTGTCCASAYEGKVVITPDIATDPAWTTLKRLPLELGLQAAWSMPILSASGKVLGTFGTYFRQPRGPSPQEVAVVEVLSKTTAIALERQFTTAALRESRVQLETALNAARMGRWDWDIANGEITWSPQCYALYGFPSTEPPIDLERWKTCVHPHDLPKLEESLAMAMAGKQEHYEIVHRVVWPDKSVHWLEVRGKCYCSETHQPLRLTGVVFDITALKEAEAELRRRENLYRGVGESINYGIWVCDAEGRNIYTSESFLKLIGLTQQECAGFGWGRALRPADRDTTLAAWRECVRTGGFWEREEQFLGADRKWYSILVRGLPIRDETGQVTCWAGIHLDITALKRTEHALRDAQAKLLQHAEELERRVLTRTTSLHQAVTQMEEFSYTVSHDLRAPLRAMKGFAEVLLEEYGERIGDGKYYLERIIHNGQRMEKLVTDLLTVNRSSRAEIRLERVSLQMMVDEIIQEHPSMQSPHAIIDAAALPEIHAHEPSLRQALTNLLENAVKFVKTGTKPEVKIEVHLAEEGVWISIKDNGIGIRNEHQEKIFELFERIHPDSDYGGTGIGLSLVRKAVERMGGQVGVESDGEHGSRFWIYLSKPKANT